MGTRPRLESEALLEIASRLGTIGVRYGVPANARFAFVSDAMFEVAVLLDDATGGSVHESILGLLGEHQGELSVEPPPADHVVGEVEVRFEKGRKAELAVLASHLEAEKHLRLVLEIALGVREVEELRARVDVEARFADRRRTRGGVTTIRFRRAGSRASKWQSVPLRGSSFGDFDETVRGLMGCILAVARGR
jgi:hypothetical protein